MKRMNSPHLRRINLDRKFLFETFSASLPPKKSCGVWVGVVTTPKGLSESYSSSHTYLQLDNGSSPSKALLIWTTEESGNYGRKGGSCNILKKISWNTRFDFQSILISIGWKIRFDVYPQIWCLSSILRFPKRIGFHNIFLGKPRHWTKISPRSRLEGDLASHRLSPPPPQWQDATTWGHHAKSYEICLDFLESWNEKPLFAMSQHPGWWVDAMWFNKDVSDTDFETLRLWNSGLLNWRTQKVLTPFKNIAQPLER